MKFFNNAFPLPEGIYPILIYLILLFSSSEPSCEYKALTISNGNPSPLNAKIPLYLIKFS